jgi:hypothetical protein
LNIQLIENQFLAMKKTLFWIAPFALFAFAACEEKPIEIPDLKVGKRRVLVEEITGVGCSNCPKGAKTLTNLQSTFKADGRELIVVSIHAAGDFSEPYTGNPANLYDFRSADAQALANFVGAVEGYPTAAINRLLLPNETSTFLTPHTRWEGIVRAEFGKDYGLGLFVGNTYEPTTRRLDISVDILPDQTILGDHRLTVLITQDSIADLQNDNNVYVTNYIHRHVLRDAVSKADGDAIGEPLTGGAVIRKTYSLNLPAEWDEKHCSVVAYLHRTGNPDKEVLQAAESYVVD